MQAWQVFVLGMDGDLPKVLSLFNEEPAIASASVRLLSEDWAKQAVASEKTPNAASAPPPPSTGRLLTQGPAVYGGTFAVAESARLSTGLLPDTYLDVQGWGKGIAWVNGHNLGWYWPLVRCR